MRCPDCAKMVSYDTEVEPEEEQAPEVSAEGDFTATYRRVLACGECSNELKDASIEFNENILGDNFPLCKDDGEGGHIDHEWEVEVTVNPTMDVEGKGRGARTFYGVELDGEAKCVHCGATAKIELKNHEQASGFNELV